MVHLIHNTIPTVRPPLLILKWFTFKDTSSSTTHSFLCHLTRLSLVISRALASSPRLYMSQLPVLFYQTPTQPFHPPTSSSHPSMTRPSIHIVLSGLSSDRPYLSGVQPWLIYLALSTLPFTPRPNPPVYHPACVEASNCCNRLRVSTPLHCKVSGSGSPSSRDPVKMNPSNPSSTPSPTRTMDEGHPGLEDLEELAGAIYLTIGQRVGRSDGP